MDLTLVVMAAGMGSRFGGLKQITPIDDDGNFIIDYSIYDAIRYGFKKVVFVIREEFFNDFKNTIGKRLENKVEVCYAFQKLEDIPVDIDISKRSKPWGTAQAILAAKPYVNGSFAVINADDFYGSNAYLEAANFLNNVKNPYHYACISYAFFDTKSLEGAVKRGVLSLDENKVTSIIESSIECVDDKVIASPLNGDTEFSILPDAPVSMNFFAFQNDIFSILEEYWKQYFNNSEEKIMEGEVLLPDCLNKNIINGKITMDNYPSHSKWLGMTYRSDLDIVKENIQELKNQNVYKEHLWEDFCGKRED